MCQLKLFVSVLLSVNFVQRESLLCTFSAQSLQEVAQQN